MTLYRSTIHTFYPHNKFAPIQISTSLSKLTFGLFTCLPVGEGPTSLDSRTVAPRNGGAGLTVFPTTEMEDDQMGWIEWSVVIFESDPDTTLPPAQDMAASSKQESKGICLNQSILFHQWSDWVYHMNGRPRGRFVCLDYCIRKAFLL